MEANTILDKGQNDQCWPVALRELDGRIARAQFARLGTGYLPDHAGLGF